MSRFHACFLHQERDPPPNRKIVSLKYYDFKHLLENIKSQIGSGSEPQSGEQQIDKYHGARCWVAGWGHSFYNGKSLDAPRSVGVNLLKREYCIKHSLYPEVDFFELTNDIFCAGIPHNNKTKINSQGYHVTSAGADYCKGDTGGPLVCDINGTLTLIGIVAKQFMCNKEGFPGIYTNIQAHRPWLDECKFKFAFSRKLIFITI